METRHGVRFTAPDGGRVTVLVDGEFRASEVSVCVGGRTLCAANADVERVETRHGATYSEEVAALLARHAAIVREACEGERSYDDVITDLDALEHEVRAKCGPDDHEACAEMIVARAMIPAIVL